MTGRADFTDEEWKTVLERPTSAGLLVITADRGGSIRESSSMAKAYSAARKEHGESKLLDENVEAKPEMDQTRYETAESSSTAASSTSPMPSPCSSRRTPPKRSTSTEARPRAGAAGRRGPQGGVHGPERRAGDRGRAAGDRRDQRRSRLRRFRRADPDDCVD